MEEKVIKPHGMSSDKASRVKIRGHNKEHIFSNVIKGLVLVGTKKQDVINRYGQLFSLKGGSEIKGKEGRDGKWSLILYGQNRFNKEKDFPAREIILDIFSCYPEKYSDYEISKKEVKDKVAINMVRLKDYLLNEENRIEFLDKSFFDRKVDFFVVYHDEIFHIFDKEEVWNTFLKHLEVDNNKTNQKVVLKYKKLCGEIEIRTTNDGKYPSVFFCMRKLVAFNLLTEKITRIKKFTPVLWLYGNAIKKYKH